MSIWSTTAVIGETGTGVLDGTVLVYAHSGAWPTPGDPSSWVDLATIPTDYLRLFVPDDTVVLTVEGATRLRDELTEWIEGRGT